MKRKQKADSLEGYKLKYEDVPDKRHRGKSRKVLTKGKASGIIERVKKLKRKDDKMAHDKNKNSNKFDVVKSVAWLVEAAFRAFVGWILLTKFDNYVTTVAALYALGTAAVIVVSHFVKAHK